MRHGWPLLALQTRQRIIQDALENRTDCPGPFHMEIDPFNRCNARCYFCNSTALHDGAVLDWEVLRPALECAHAGGLTSVRLAGGGEPTLYPHMDELLDWLGAHDVHLDNLTTNGLKLKGPMAHRLVQNPPSFLFVSLNYATAESYARGMGLPPERFEEVTENIRNFKEALARHNPDSPCQLHVQFMISRQTLGDLPAMFALAERLGVTGLTLRALSLRPQEERLDPDQRQRLMAEVAPLAHAYREKVWIMFDLAEEGLATEAQALTAELYPAQAEGAGPAAPRDGADFSFCLLPWYSMTILGSGKVYPCCMLLSNPQVSSLGDITTQPLEAIWNGPAFRHYRHEMRRSMILGGPVPGWGKLCRYTTAACWHPGACPLARDLLGPDDAPLLARRIRQARASAGGRLTRLTYATVRRLIDTVRQK